MLVPFRNLGASERAVNYEDILLKQKQNKTKHRVSIFFKSRYPHRNIYMVLPTHIFTPLRIHKFFSKYFPVRRTF